MGGVSTAQRNGRLMCQTLMTLERELFTRSFLGPEDRVSVCAPIMRWFAAHAAYQ